MPIRVECKDPEFKGQTLYTKGAIISDAQVATESLPPGVDINSLRPFRRINEYFIDVLIVVGEISVILKGTQRRHTITAPPLSVSFEAFGKEGWKAYLTYLNKEYRCRLLAEKT